MPSNNPRINIRFPVELMARVRAAASKAGQSVNAYVRAVLEEKLRKEEK